MCQLVRDGGRRCPIHRHITKAVIRNVRISTPELTQTQIEKLFVELRREGASANIADTAYAEFLANQQGDENGTDRDKAYVERQLELAGVHDTEVDSQNRYALMLLKSRAESRAREVKKLLDEVADKTGLLPEEVDAAYKKYMSEVETGRGSEIPEEYTNRTRNQAARAGLPYDRASVVAFEKLNKLANPVEEQVRRVTHCAPTRPSTVIKSYGYDEGRLEVVLHNNPGVIYAYQNVSEVQWSTLLNAQRPGAMLRTFRSHPEYSYPNEEEAEAAGYSYRCASCGQFRAATERHLCPNLIIREDLLTAGLTTEEINDELSNSLANQGETIEGVMTPTLMEEKPAITVYPDMPNLLESREHVRDNIFNNTSDHESFVSLESLMEAQTGTVLDPVSQNMYGTTSNMVPKILTPSDDNHYLIRIDRVPELTQVEFISRADKDAVTSFINRAAEETGIPRYSCGAKVVLECRKGTTLAIRVVAMYNSRQVNDYLGETVPGTSGSGQLSCFSKIAMYPLPKAFTAGSNQITLEDSQNAEREFNEFCQKGLEDGKIVELDSLGSLIPTTLTAGRNYIRGDGGIATLRHSSPAEAYMNGAAVLQEVRIEYNHSRMQRDDVLYGTQNIASGTVTGKAVTRMTPEGEVQIIARSLKCECADYREKYECAHIYLAAHDIPKIDQAVAVVETGISSDNPIVATTYSQGHSISYSPWFDRPIINFLSSTSNIKVEGSLGNVQPMPVGSNARFEELEAWRIANPDQLLSFEDASFVYEYHMATRQEERGMYVSRPASDTYIDMYNSGHDVSIPFQSIQIDSDGRYTVQGSVIFSKHEGEGNASTRSLRCDCDDYASEYRCEHLDKVATILPRYMESVNDLENNSLGLNTEADETVGEIPTRQNLGALLNDCSYYNQAASLTRRSGISLERAYANVISLIAADLEREATARRIREEGQAFWDAHRESRIELWRDVTPTLSGTPEAQAAFNDAVADIQRRKRRGETILEFKPEGGVTDGICAAGADTRSFGIELEFDLGNSDDRDQSIENIGRELYNAGLSNVSYQDDYHASHGTWENWSLESDSTVAGEIVSPLLKDTPEDWAKVAQVVDIVKRNGGTASVSVGAHINISSASYGGGTAKHASLSRLITQNFHTLYRVASDPHRGSHRGSRWCTPDISLPSANIPMSRMGPRVENGNGVYAQHGNIVNYDASVHVSDPRGYKAARIEYRLWDGTLDVAVLQQQVAFSAALTDYAEREAIQSQGYFYDSGHTQEIDEHVQAASLFDRIFRTEEQRTRATQLFAINNSTGGVPPVQEVADDFW